MNAVDVFQRLKGGLPLLSTERHAYNLVWGLTHGFGGETEACIAAQFEMSKIPVVEGERAIGAMLDAGLIMPTIIDARRIGCGYVAALRRTTAAEQMAHVLRPMWPVA